MLSPILTFLINILTLLYPIQVLLANSNDSDDFFVQQKEFLVNYHSNIKNATNVSDRLVNKRKGLSQISLNSYAYSISLQIPSNYLHFFFIFSLNFSTFSFNFH